MASNLEVIDVCADDEDLTQDDTDENEKEEMKLLGIDPNTKSTGFVCLNLKGEVIHFGVVKRSGEEFTICTAT